jgi:Glycosyl hydrolase family 79 C-terminal beta domain
MAELLGPSNTSQVLDLNANSGNPLTPAYAIYENGNPVRVALFNYVTDPSGNSAITASISIGGGQTGQPNATPSEVKVKYVVFFFMRSGKVEGLIGVRVFCRYLAASSVSQKGNFTWAGQVSLSLNITNPMAYLLTPSTTQTFGDVFGSDGRLNGSENIQTTQCNQANNVCQIQVPAPGFALVFLNDNTQAGTGAGPSTTYSTSLTTRTHNTVSVDPSVLATSNGHMGMDQKMGSTSSGSVSAAVARERERAVGALIAMTAAVCAAVVMRW